MANHLSVAKVQSILTLHDQGWSQRRIARELGVHRETVGNCLRRSRIEGSPGSKPANAPPGSEASSGDSKPANAPPGSSKPAIAPTGSDGPIQPPTPSGSRASTCQPWREVIQAKLNQNLSAQRIWQDLKAETGAPVSYYSVRRYVRKLLATQPLPFRRMECGPGQEAQVDFGTGAPVIGLDGRRRRTYVFRIVLSHSRKAYSEAVFHQTTEDFLRCLENAFSHFGGVPQTLVLDNLKAAVQQADWFDPELNPQVQSFCTHYGIVALPTKPYTPRHKGKVERGIDYVQDNALKGRQFASLEEENRHLLHWEATIADTRIHGTTRKQVNKVFTEVERPTLRPLPDERFPYFKEARRVVHRDGHVEVQKAYYSVPCEYLSHRLWVRWDSHLVRIFDEQMRPIAVHVRQEPGRFSTQPVHIPAAKISGVEQGSGRLLFKAQQVGDQIGQWAQAMLQTRGIEGVRVLLGLLSLAKKHPHEDLERVCEVANSHGVYRLRPLRQLLKRPHPTIGRQASLPDLELIQEHPLIRSLSDYTRFVREVLGGDSPVFDKETMHESGVTNHPAAVATVRPDPKPGSAAAGGFRSSVES